MNEYVLGATLAFVGIAIIVTPWLWLLAIASVLIAALVTYDRKRERKRRRQMYRENLEPVRGRRA